MKLHLATFFSPDLSRSAKRFKDQATEMKIYDKINMYRFDDLDIEFKNYVKKLLKDGKKRGYGYWVWQTFVHKHVLSNLNEGDFYHWCDVGCHFNTNGKKRLEEYLNILQNEDTGFLGFDYEKLDNDEFKNFTYPRYLEYEYTKEDLFKFFKVQDKKDITNTPQVWGGSFFVKKCPTSMKILNNHFEITKNRFDLIDDDKDKFLEKPREGFIAHRHSQSVLSILAKLEKCNFLSAYESEWALDQNNQRTFEHLHDFPIIAKRDKKKNIFRRFYERQIKTFKRYNFFFFKY